MPPTTRRPRIFVDADVVFSGAAGPSQFGASLVVLRMAEITLIDAITCEQVITEVERNLAVKLPDALPLFRRLVGRCLKVVPDADEAMRAAYSGCAHPKDLCMLATAVRERCRWLVTFNTRHFQPGHAGILVLTPGDFVATVRQTLIGLDPEP